MSDRWIVLLLISWALVGDFYCYDNPSAMKAQLRGHFAESMDRNAFETNFELLYSVYSIPNVILPFFGGVLVDKLGTRSTLIGFNAILTLAAAVVALGVWWKSFALLIIGRIVYGMAGESLTVVQSAILTQWFRGKELALTFGISLAFSRGGSVANNYFSAFFADKIGINFSFFFGTFLLASCVATSVCFAGIDVAAEGRIKDRTEELEAIAERERMQHLTAALLSPKPDSEECTGKAPPEVMPAADKGAEAKPDEDLGTLGALWKELASVKNFPLMFWLVAASCILNYAVVMPWNNTAQELLLERDLFTTAQPLTECCCWAPGHCYASWPTAHGQTHAATSAEHAKCHAGCDFGNDDLKVTLNLTSAQHEYLDCGQSAPLYGLEKHNQPRIWAPDSLRTYCDRQTAAEQQAGIWMSIPYYVNVGSSPFLGFLVDRYGQCAWICFIAPLVFTFVHVLLGYTRASPLGLLVGQGVAYSCFAAAVWPPVVYIIDQKNIGAAYGVMTAGMNTGFAVFPLISAYIYQLNGNSYLPSVELFYTILAGVAALVGGALLIQDYRIGSPFNKVHWTDEKGDE